MFRRRLAYTASSRLTLGACLQPNRSLQRTVSKRRFACFLQLVKTVVNATRLRTALWRCDLGVELPHLADSSPCGWSILPFLDRNSRINLTPNIKHLPGIGFRCGTTWTGKQIVQLLHSFLTQCETQCSHRSIELFHRAWPNNRCCDGFLMQQPG